MKEGQVEADGNFFATCYDSLCIREPNIPLAVAIANAITYVSELTSQDGIRKLSGGANSV